MGCGAAKKQTKNTAMSKKATFDYKTIDSFEAACAKTGLTASLLPTTGHLAPRFAQALIDQYKLWVIIEAVNDDWEADWDNGKWDKHYPWFDMRSSASGVGFSYHVYVGGHSYSLVGSRLVFKDAARGRYVAETFPELYRSVFKKCS